MKSAAELSRAPNKAKSAWVGHHRAQYWLLASGANCLRLGLALGLVGNSGSNWFGLVPSEFLSPLALDKDQIDTCTRH